MEKINYDLKMQAIIKELPKGSTVLLHTCCAPCSSAVIARLANDFEITVFYYNPNIEPQEEYIKRKEEQQRFLTEITTLYPIHFLDCDYDHDAFENITKGLEKEKEGGSRCFKCYRLRLEQTAKIAKLNHFDYFGTSLTVSPYKNATKLNEIGAELEKIYKVNFLYSDFKKHDGYKKSIEYSKQYHLYRQDYSGCHFSKDERERQKEER